MYHPWNKGLTKETDERVRKLVDKVTKSSPFQKGCTPWNKDLPKEQQPGFGKHSNKGQSAWNKGLTKETDDRVKKYALNHNQVPWNKGKHGVQDYEHMNGNSYGFIKGKHPWNYGETYTEEQRSKYENHWSKLVSKCCQRPNIMESDLCDYLDNKFSGYEYTGNGSYSIGGKFPDFVNKNRKLVIEMFGEYWHKLEDEEIRKSHFAKYGYLALIVWSKELNDKSALYEKITKFEANKI